MNLPPPQSIEGTLGDLRGIPDSAYVMGGSNAFLYICCDRESSVHFYRVCLYAEAPNFKKRRCKICTYENVGLCAECLSHPIRLLTRDDHLWRFIGQILAENQGK